MKCITNLTEQKAQEIASKLNSLEPKILHGHSSKPIREWYTFTKPAHNPGDLYVWTSESIGADAMVEKYDGAFSVSYNEWYEEEALQYAHH